MKTDLSRRSFLAGGAALAATSVGAMLVGCKPKEPEPTPAPAPDTPTPAPAPETKIPRGMQTIVTNAEYELRLPEGGAEPSFVAEPITEFAGEETCDVLVIGTDHGNTGII